MIDSLTITRHVADLLTAALAAAGINHWQVCTDVTGPRIADARVLELRLTTAAPVVQGLSTYRLDCQLVLRGGADNSAQAAATAHDVAAIFRAALPVIQQLPGTLVTVDGVALAQFLDSRLDQLQSGILAESMAIAPVAALILWVHCADPESAN